MIRDLIMTLVVSVGLCAAVNAGESAVTSPDMSLCITCHGAAGEGNRLLNAPGLTNLETWYIEQGSSPFDGDAYDEGYAEHMKKTIY